MFGMGHRNHYRDFELQREQLMRAARREQLVRMAAENSPKTPQAYTAVLKAFLKSLFRQPRGAGSQEETSCVDGSVRYAKRSSRLS